VFGTRAERLNEDRELMLAGPSEEQQELYRLAFVENCLLLVIRAHGALDTHSHRADEEPHITGELVRAARMLLESAEAEPWMEHFEMLDDPPQNLAGRHGKNRRRIDIEFVRTGRGRRPRFHIEAKRLHRSDSVNEYFGARGLELFVRGEYAGGWPSAGMLGYFQSDSCAEWLSRLASGLAARRRYLCVCEGFPDWAPTGWEGAKLDLVRTSHHERTPEDLGRIQIFHLLLEFT
jgi:hypothetical protein